MHLASTAEAKEKDPAVFSAAWAEWKQMLAAEFSRILWNTDDGTRPITMQDVIRLNKENEESSAPDACASHEMCDSNDAMIKASEAFGMEMIFGSDFEEYPEQFRGAFLQEASFQQRLWDDAWTLAKRLEFDVDRILAHK